MRKSTFAKVLTLVLLIAVAVPSFGAFAQDEPATVVDVAAGSDVHTTLVAAVTAAELVETLSNPDAEFTVFAPVDDAFAALPEFVLNAALEDTDLLTTLLTYHVVEGTILSSDLEEGCAQVPTLQGGELTVCNDMGNVSVNSATVTTADLTAGNGVVHVIDRVVIPPVEMPDIDPLEYEGAIATAGSSTVGPLSTAVANLWASEGAAPENTPTIVEIGSGAGFERFCVETESDISNASRGIRDSEIETCQSNGRDPIEFRVGTDALAVTVSADNDFVDGLSLEDLAAIFGCEATSWSDVNPDWPEEPIQLFSPGTDSGTFDFFVEEVLDENPDGLLGCDPQLSENDDVLVEGISGSPYAIGYFGYAYYQQNSDILKILDIEGVTANAQNVDAGTYPLARPLFIYTTADIMAEKPQVGAFVGYYLANVNDVIGEVGYFPAANDALNLARLQWLVATSN